MVVNTTNSCLKLAFVQYLPYMIFGGNRDGSVLRGAIIEINKIIMAHLGYCVEYVKAPDEAAGILLPNGSWTGIIRQVVQKEVDMSGVAIAVTYDRNRFVDPTDYLFIDEWTAAFQRPVLKSDVTGFIKPFSDYVWLLIALALVGVLMTEWLLRASHSAIRKLFCLHSQVVMDGHDSNTGLRIFAIFLSQSLPRMPRGHSMRVLTCFWLLVAFILTTVYRSNLKAMLILPKIVLPFDSPEELVESGIPVWVPRGSALHIAGLLSPPGSTLAKILDHSNSLDQPTDPVWGIGDMLAGKHVMSSPRASIVYQMHDTFSKTGGKCLSYAMSESLIGMVQISFMFPEGSPLKKEINHVVRRLKQFGILDYEYRKQIANATECLKPISAQIGGNDLRPLDLGDFYGVFMLYGAGLFLAFLVFMTEVVASHTEKSKRKNETTE